MQQKHLASARLEESTERAARVQARGPRAARRGAVVDVRAPRSARPRSGRTGCGRCGSRRGRRRSPSSRSPTCRSWPRGPTGRRAFCAVGRSSRLGSRRRWRSSCRRFRCLGNGCFRTVPYPLPRRIEGLPPHQHDGRDGRVESSNLMPPLRHRRDPSGTSGGRVTVISRQRQIPPKLLPRD